MFYIKWWGREVDKTIKNDKILFFLIARFNLIFPVHSTIQLYRTIINHVFEFRS
jgi:hypothetical protein